MRIRLGPPSPGTARSLRGLPSYWAGEAQEPDLRIDSGGRVRYRSRLSLAAVASGWAEGEAVEPGSCFRNNVEGTPGLEKAQSLMPRRFILIVKPLREIPKSLAA
jgi:hypothetical protein